ncbi:MAG: hypothetical protein QM500_02350 [Methylococcales bacterium]
MNIESISEGLNELSNAAQKFFEEAITMCEDDGKPAWNSERRVISAFWDLLDENLKSTSHKLQHKLLEVIPKLIPVVKNSPLLNETDEKEIGICLKRMRAALRLRDFRSWNVEVLHDEGTVLGVNPSGQSEDDPSTPIESKNHFDHCANQLRDIIEFLSAAPVNIPDGLPTKNPNLSQSYKPNTAFIMMNINPNNPELEDVYDTYKNCFKKFGIEAIRADEIEHEDVITNKIIEEIKTSEFLVGDLTGERPSVYYEIGYAHSLGRRVIMYRKQGTSIHFDLVAYNCPEYRNMKDLNELLIKRLEQATNRKPENG